KNNYSGQFARYLRSESSYVPNGYIRKYDGEPFMPHHIVEPVKDQLTGKTTLSVPAHEITVRGEEEMATSLAAPKQLALADLNGKVDPDWCPGCAVSDGLAAVQKALDQLQ